jgi:hypothetical protein
MKIEWSLFHLAVAGALLCAPAPALAETRFPVLEVRDFSGDGQSDLIARCASGPPGCALNTYEIWFMNGPTLLKKTAITPALTSAQRVVGAGDFNGDKWADLVVASSSRVDPAEPLPSSTVAFWPMHGTTRSGTAIALRAPEAVGWEVVATADFDGRNGPDILWRHAGTGQLVISLIKDFRNVGRLIPDPGHAIGANWSVVAVQDFGNGHQESDGRTAAYDGHPDLLWSEPELGAFFWFMDGGLRRIAERFLVRPKPAMPGPWSVASAGDYGPFASSGPRHPGIVWWQELLPLEDPSKGGSGSIIIDEVNAEGVATTTGPLPGHAIEVPYGWRLVGPR